MINVENEEKKVLKKTERINPFCSFSVHCVFIHEGQCNLIFLANNTSKLVGKLRKNSYLFRNEFTDIDIQSIVLEASEDSLIYLLKNEQLDSLSVDFTNMSACIQRIHAIHSMKKEEVILSPDSKIGVKAFNGTFQVIATQFPFQVGRYSHKKVRFPSMKNDFYLFDKKPYQISRVHFRLEKRKDGFYYRDLKSKLGSWVNGIQLSSHSLLETKLNLGKNQIFLGKKSSAIILSIFINN